MTRSLPSILFFLVVLFFIVPEIVFDRFHSTIDMVQQSSDLNDINDSRFKLISATFYHFFDAFPFGIGQGNYFGSGV